MGTDYVMLKSGSVELSLNEASGTLGFMLDVAEPLDISVLMAREEPKVILQALLKGITAVSYYMDEEELGVEMEKLETFAYKGDRDG